MHTARPFRKQGILFVLVFMSGFSVGCAAQAQNAVISPDGKYFAQSTGSSTTIFEVETGKTWKELKGTSASNLKFSSNSKFLASGNVSELVLWDCAEGKALATWKGDNRWSFKMDFSQDGSLLAARDDRSLRVWQTAKQQLVLTIPMPYEMDSLAFSPNGKFLAVAGTEIKEKEPRGHEIKVWEVPSSKLLMTLQGPEYCIVKSLAFSPDGEYLATGLSMPAARLWAISTRKEVWKQEVESVDYNILTFSADGKELIVGGYQSLIRLDVEKGKVLKKHELPGSPITSVAATAKPALLFVTKKNSVSSIDLESGKEQRLLSR